MSWVKLLTKVNMSLSSNVVFGYQESFRKLKSYANNLFLIFKFGKKMFIFSISINIKELEVFNF